MKVLIVDDSKAMRLIVGRGLRELGVPGTPYLEAPDGKAALTTIQNERPDLVISDFNMPGMNGMQVLAAMREANIKTCFGFVTSEASAQLHEEAEQAGAQFVITKPFTAANLGLTLRPLLAEIGCDDLSGDFESPKTFATANTDFPKMSQVVAILKDLLRRPVVAATAPKIALPPKEGYMIAEYLCSDDNSVVACGISDIAFAARVGAALSLVPQTAAAEAIAARRVTDTIGDNYREVLNVMSRLFDGGGNSRVCLGRTHTSRQGLSPELTTRITKPSARLDLSVEVSGYGTGNITLLSLPANA